MASKTWGITSRDGGSAQVRPPPPLHHQYHHREQHHHEQHQHQHQEHRQQEQEQVQPQRDRRPPPLQRPISALQCQNLADAYRFRRQIVREVSDRMLEIQDRSLPEVRVRDLNDALNRLLREKQQWDARIRQMGGESPPHGAAHIARDAVKTDGGYFLFGAAKDLPGMRSQLSQEQEQQQEEARQAQAAAAFRRSLESRIDDEYLGKTARPSPLASSSIFMSDAMSQELLAQETDAEAREHDRAQQHGSPEQPNRPPSLRPPPLPAFFPEHEIQSVLLHLKKQELKQRLLQRH